MQIARNVFILCGFIKLSWEFVDDIFRDYCSHINDCIVGILWLKLICRQ